MRLKFKEKLNNLITNKVDLGEVVYADEKIVDSNFENNLYDVYGRPSVYKENAFYDIKNDCKNVHGYGLHITSHNINFFSTAFFVKLDGVLYKIVDTPSQRIAYTNDERFDFSGIKIRVYGCRDKWTRDRIRTLVKPYLKAIDVKKARIDYIGLSSEVGFKFLINNCHMTENELDNFNIEHYKTYINL